jgi:hypothetical protein
MRVIKRFTTSIAASLLLGAVAHASDAPDGGYGGGRNSEAVKATTLPWNVQTIQRLSPTTADHYAEPDRTSKIGTGAAGAPERVDVDESFQRVSSVTPHYPEPHWTSKIGTGTAAVLKR